MLHISDLRDNKNSIIEKLLIKNFNAEVLINSAIAKDNLRKLNQQKSDEILAKSNQIAREIGVLYKNGETHKVSLLKEQSLLLKQESKDLSVFKFQIEKEIKDILVQIPNTPHHSVKIGNSDKDNEILNEVGVIPKLDENAKPHWELTEQYDIIDFKLGNKITGAGFPVYKGKGARLQRALIQYFLENLHEFCIFLAIIFQLWNPPNNLLFFYFKMRFFSHNSQRKYLSNYSLQIFF